MRKAAAALMLMLAAPAAAGAQDDAGFPLLVRVAEAARDHALEPIDAATVAGFMSESLRGADPAEREAMLACEAEGAARRQHDKPEFARPLALSWDCARRRHPEIEEMTLAGTTIQAALLRFDPHATFVPRLSDLYGTADDAPASTGLTLQAAPGEPVAVHWLMRGGPAARAGIAIGDRLVAIDGAQVQGLPLDQVVRMLRGPLGSAVTLTLIPGGSAAAVERRLVRELWQPGEVAMRRHGELAILTFGAMWRTTPQSLRDHLSAALAGSDRPRAVLIDLRGNDGGLLDATVEMADEFIEEGVILTVAERRAPVRYRAHRGSRTGGLPLYVLVDGSTASGGEAFATALADGAGARIIGQRTMGRGEIRSLFPIAPDVAVTLTTGRMLRRNGAPIEAGITPDIPIDATPVPPGAGDADPVLDRAVEALRADLAGRAPGGL